MYLHLIAWLSLLGDEIHNALDFLVGDQRALGSDQFRRPGWQIEHVSFAEQLIGPHGIQDRARVHLRRDLKSNSRRYVGFDHAGDHIDTWPLRGDNAMNPRSPGHLRDPRDRHFDVRRRDQHQVGQLIHDNHDVTQLFRNQNLIVTRHHDLFIDFHSETVGPRFYFFLARH